MARLQHTIDNKLKKQAENILKKQGIPPRVATNMFYIEIVKQGGLPFHPSRVENKKTQQACKDVSNKSNLSGPYQSPEDLFHSLEE